MYDCIKNNIVKLSTLSSLSGGAQYQLGFDFTDNILTTGNSSNEQDPFSCSPNPAAISKTSVLVVLAVALAVAITVVLYLCCKNNKRQVSPNSKYKP